MKIIVINGSPSGTRGTTAQYIQYIEREFPTHRFEVVEVARRIRKIERDPSNLEAIVEGLRSADGVIWCFPVYFMLVPAQLQRFIELLLEQVGPSGLAGKVATAISSSAHFYDHTAHDYVAAISADLGMTFVQGFSGGMDDLQRPEGRHDVMGFARSFLRHVSGEQPVDAPAPAVRPTSPAYAPSPVSEVPITGHKRIVVITDAGPEDGNLKNMIDQFERSVSHPVDRLDLNELRMDGGCLGCMGCADDGVCGYRDDYAAAFDERVKPADVVVYAGAVRGRFFSARVKTFIDRYFRYGHRPAGQRQLVGFLVSGPLGQLATMNQVLEATVEIAHSQRLGTVTDEHADATVTTSRLQSMARAVDAWLADPWFLPATFLGVGGAKIFRDLVYENKGVLSADHRFYRDNGMYDFPQNNLEKRLVMATMLLCKRIPFLRKRVARALRQRRRGQLSKLPAQSERPQPHAI